jgi:hypothetical protein
MKIPKPKSKPPAVEPPPRISTSLPSRDQPHARTLFLQAWAQPWLNAIPATPRRKFQSPCLNITVGLRLNGVWLHLANGNKTYRRYPTYTDPNSWRRSTPELFY